MYYNLSEEQKVFLHISYSLLEEGYGVEEVIEFWKLNDEENSKNILESLSLTETIDLSNEDLQIICEEYLEERLGKFLSRLFGKQKIRAPRPTGPVSKTTKGGKPITGDIDPSNPTTKGGKPITGTSTPQPSAAPQNKPRLQIPPGLKEKGQKLVVPGLVIGGGLVAGLLSPGESPDKPAETKTEKPEGPTTTTPPTTAADEKAKAEAEAKAKAEADAKAKAEAEAKAKAEAELPDKGWWKAERQPGLWKKSASYKAGLEAYRNVRANPVPSIYRDHYDLIADYLINEGHASTIEEAEYVMQQLDDDFIQSIVEAGEGRVNLTYPAGHPKYGQPLKVDGKPMSVSKRTAEWNSKMNRYKEQNPAGYKKAKSMMGPYGWTEPPKGYNPPDWM